MKYLFMLLAVVMVSAGFSSCSDDDTSSDLAEGMAGDYRGTLMIVGYNDEFIAYATLTRRSETEISLVVDCYDEAVDLHLNSVILNISREGNSYILTSDTKAVSGTVIGSSLNLTFSAGNYAYTFYGNKQ